MGYSASIPINNPKTSPTSIAILFLVSLLFAILVIEITGRIIPGLIPEVVRLYFLDLNYEQGGLIGDKDLGFKYAANLVDFPIPFEVDEGGRSTYPVSTVSLGYQDAGFRDDGIDGETFAIVIGDSFAGCAGVRMDECWVEVLEEKNGRDFVNLGVAGYGPQQIQRMLTKYGLPLKPKLVLWVYYANDPDDAWRFRQFGKAEAKEGQFWNSAIRSWLVQNSVTYEVLAFSWYNRRFLYNLAVADGETLPLEPSLVWWQTATDLENPTVAEGFNLMQAAILEAYQQTQTELGGTRFVVVIIPTREQIYYRDTILQSQLDALSANLVNFSQKHNISVIDLTADMRTRIEDEPFLYFRHDLHLNPRGNAVVAELLEKNLAEMSSE